MAARNQQSSEENPFRSEDDLLILTFKKLWLKKTSMAENLQTVFLSHTFLNLFAGFAPYTEVRLIY